MMRRKSSQRWLHGGLLTLAALLLTGLLQTMGGLQQLEWLSYDWRSQALRQEVAAPEDVAVILIDEAAINTMAPLVGRWPWPRSLHADIIDFLSLGQPRAIVFDILFTETEQAEITQEDLRLVESTAVAGNVVHAMQMLSDEQDEFNTSLLNQALPEEIKPFSLTGLLASNNNLARQNNNRYYLPFSGLDEISAVLGVVNVLPDADGSYRHARLIHNYQGQLFPSLALAPLTAQVAKLELSDHELRLDDDRIPIDDKQQMLVNHYGQFDTYSMSGIIASAQQLQAGEVDQLIIDPLAFENKIIFIGASAAGLEDLKRTPLSGTTPGVFLHAAAVANIFHDEILRPSSQATTLVSSLIAAAITALCVLGSRHLITQISIPLSLSLGYVWLSFYLFEQYSVINLSQPLMAATACAIFCFVYIGFTEGRDKRRVRTMLAQYVSPAVLTKVVENFEDQLSAEVGSEEQLSILFSDIRGFTNLSESLPAATIVDILNHYFSQMNEAIFANQGTIDKFIGDAIMAFWGAPIKTDRHADQALAAAIEMHRRLARVNEWLKEQHYPEIQIGIGINSGSVILGNIGSHQKLDYTVIGDNVNLASRLEGLTKQYGAAIVISENTYQQLQTPYPSYLLDLVRVKGKQAPIRIYAPIIDQADELKQTLADTSLLAFEKYLNRDWAEAIQLYQSLPEQRFTQALIERCQHYQQQAPADDWDGVHIMTTK